MATIVKLNRAQPAADIGSAIGTYLGTKGKRDKKEQAREFMASFSSAKTREEAIGLIDKNPNMFEDASDIKAFVDAVDTRFKVGPAFPNDANDATSQATGQPAPMDMGIGIGSSAEQASIPFRPGAGANVAGAVQGATAPQEVQQPITQQEKIRARIDRKMQRIDELDKFALANPGTDASKTAQSQANSIRTNVEGLLKIAGKDVQQIQAEEKARKAGELEARVENINRIMDAADISIREQGQTPPGEVKEAFSGKEQGSDDARRMTRMFLQANRLLQAGESALANTLLSQARFLADNSPDIQRQKDLNKPVSHQTSAELQIPVGTTLGDIMDLIPPTLEDASQQRAVGGARGRAAVEAEETLGFISEARGILSPLMSEIERDPGIVGIRGSLRKTGKSAIGVISDLGLKSVVESAKNIALSNSDMTADQYQGMFTSPTLSSLQIIENSVGMISARIRTPDQRLPLDVINRSIAEVKLTGLTSSEQVKDRLEFIDSLFSVREEALKQRFGMQSSPVTDIEQDTNIEDPSIPNYRFNVNTDQLEKVGGK